MTVPIYITAAILAVIVAFCADKAGKRSPFVITPMFTMLVGFTMYVYILTTEATKIAANKT